jgi:hypothetical protein
MTSTRRLDGTAGVQSIAERRRTVESRRAALQNLQRLAIQLEAASTLERRADRANPTLAAVLRGRADERRRIAAIIHSHLDGRGLSTSLSRTLSGPIAGTR